MSPQCETQHGGTPPCLPTQDSGQSRNQTTKQHAEQAQRFQEETLIVQPTCPKQKVSFNPLCLSVTVFPERLPSECWLPCYGLGSHTEPSRKAAEYKHSSMALLLTAIDCIPSICEPSRTLSPFSCLL